MCQCAARRERAFTLVELLVVIAIILLLFGLLLPTFQGIEALKMNTHCQKNLQEIGKAFSAYAMMNGGWYPHPVDCYYGQKFTGRGYQSDPWAIFPQLNQLRQVGAKVEIFFCPFDPIYGDWDAWPASTWTTPYVSDGNAWVNTGYTMLTYRGWGGGGGPTSQPGGPAFADGRCPIGNDSGDDDIPIVADRLWYRNGGNYKGLKGGWCHGGGPVDGLFNSDCNTLFKGGYVVHTDAAEFDWNMPAIIIGNDLYWFALNR